MSACETLATVAPRWVSWDDQPFLLEAEQRLADRPAAHRELACEVVLDQSRARRELAGQNRFADGIDDVVHEDAALARLDGLVEGAIGHEDCLQFAGAFAKPVDVGQSAISGESMRILKVNTYAPDSPLYQAFGPDVTFDIHRSGSEAVAPPVAEFVPRSPTRVINCSATLPLGVDLDAFERCRIVVREGVGYDNLDLAGWGARGVPVCNVPDYGTTEVADHALALTLALTRGTGTYDESLRADPVPGHYATAPLVRRLRGATFAVLGLGRIGLAARAGALPPST